MLQQVLIKSLLHQTPAWREAARASIRSVQGYVLQGTGLQIFAHVFGDEVNSFLVSGRQFSRHRWASVIKGAVVVILGVIRLELNP